MTVRSRSLLALLVALLLGIWPTALAHAAKPSRASVSNQRGLELYRNKRLAAAAAAFREAIASEPTHVVSRYNLACVEALLGHRDLAVEQLAWLKAEGGALALAKLRRARTDPDLLSLQSDSEVRAILDGVSFVPSFEQELVAVREISATSTFVDGPRGAGSPTVLLRARARALEENPEDGAYRLWNTWCEGRPDAGIGEGVTLVFAEPTSIDTIEIAAGDWRSPKHLRERNRPIELRVSIDDAAPIVATPPPSEQAEPWFVVPLPKTKVTTLAIRVAAVRAGAVDDSCLSAVRLRRAGKPLVPVIGVPPAAVLALPEALRLSNDAVAGREAEALLRALAFPFTYVHRESVRAVDGVRDRSYPFADVVSLRAACSKARAHCPEPFDGPELLLDTGKPGHVEVTGRDGRHETWHFVWREERWRLVRIDSSYVEY